MTNWKENYSSKSKWRTTIDVYETILKDEFTDTDYWFSVGGSDINSKLAMFSDVDWDKLKEDLIYWKSNQVEILGLILPSASDYFEIKDLSAFQSHKSRCYTYILNICGDDLFIDLLDELNFIKLNKQKDINELLGLKERLIQMKNTSIINNDNSTEYFYTQSRFNDFIELVDEEIKCLKNNSR
jgi:hypothetical protein